MDNLSIEDRVFDSQNSLTPDEFAQLQSVRELQQALITELGQIEFNKILLATRHEEIQAKILTLQKEQQVFVQGLNNKYGSISINIEDGTFQRTPQNS